MNLIRNARVLTSSFDAQQHDVLIDKGVIADVVPRGSVKGEGMECMDASHHALMVAPGDVLHAFERCNVDYGDAEAEWGCVTLTALG